MTGMEADGNGRTIIFFETAIGADHHDIAVGQGLGVPAHAGIDGHAENIAARGITQRFRSQRQYAVRSVCMCARTED